MNESATLTVAFQQVELDLLYVAPGSHMMGSDYALGPVTSTDACVTTNAFAENEAPVHEVVLSRGYYLGEYEVTQAQFEAVTGTNPSEVKRPSRPVEVTWDEALAFCGALSELTGKEFRLPTEAEWEYACRAGTRTDYCFGNDRSMLGEYAWYDRNSHLRSLQIVAGVKRSNAWGFHDMHGSMWEWCSDWYAEDYYAESPRVDPTGPEAGDEKVLRGGMWSNEAECCRSASRLGGRPKGQGAARCGFRIACSR